MAEMEPASRLVSLTDDDLEKLHSKLHKSTDDNASVELHHLVTTEISRRGKDHGHHGDIWSTLEIEVDKALNVDLSSMSESLPLQDHDAFVKELGLTHGDVTVVLTIDGYEMRVDPSELDEEFNTEFASVEKTIREENGKFTVYDATEQKEFGTYDTLAQAKQRLRQIEYFAKSDNSFSPPEGVQSAAQRALEWIRDGKSGDGFTAVGRRRATQLATGDQVGLDTLVRMRSYFARHAVDKKGSGFYGGDDDYPSAGRVAWDAWGGDAGRAWAESILETELGKAYDPSEDLSDRQKALYAAIEGVASRFGAFDGSSYENGAHYICADDNVFASKGIKCANCVFYLGGGGCEIMDESVEADAVCKFWIIPDSLITEMDSMPEDDGADIIDPVPLTLLTADQLEKHGNHDQSVHGGHGGGGSATATLGSKVPEAGISDAPALSAEVQSAVVNTWGKKNYKVYYSGGFQQGDSDRAVNPTLASVRAKSKLAERDKYASKVPTLEVGSESMRTTTFRIADLDGYIDGALGKSPKANMPWDTGLRSMEPPTWVGQLSGVFGKSEEVEKHGDHDQSSHARRGASTVAGQRRSGKMDRNEVPSPSGIRRDKDGRVINPDATGGYKAGIPEEVTFNGEPLTPEHSLWHHLESDPDNAGEFRITAERQKVYNDMVETATVGVPKSDDPTFFMLGGGTAAGKSTALERGIEGLPTERSRQAVFVNADTCKEGLPEYRRMSKSANDTDFFLGANFVHEESSIVSKMVEARAKSNGQNIVLDGTGDSKFTKLQSKVDGARASGYKVKAIYATVPTDMAVSRARARSLGPEKRYVSDSLVRGIHADVSRVFPQAIAGGLFDSAVLLDTNVPKGFAPKVIGRWGPKGTPMGRVDAKAYAEFISKGNK